jgi:hypothetical protein
MHDNTNNHSHSSGVIKCIIHELVHVRIKVRPFQLPCALDSSQFQIYDNGYSCTS